MRKMLIAAVLLAGCSGDDGPLRDPHELVTCDATWFGIQTCEAACATMPDVDPRLGACTATATTPDGQTGEVVCLEGAFRLNGEVGCCVQGGADRVEDRWVLYAVCNP
jgi:hypothetical protein